MRMEVYSAASGISNQYNSTDVMFFKRSFCINYKVKHALKKLKYFGGAQDGKSLPVALMSSSR